MSRVSTEGMTVLPTGIVEQTLCQTPDQLVAQWHGVLGLDLQIQSLQTSASHSRHIADSAMVNFTRCQQQAVVIHGALRLCSPPAFPGGATSLLTPTGGATSLLTPTAPAQIVFHNSRWLLCWWPRSVQLVMLVATISSACFAGGHDQFSWL